MGRSVIDPVVGDPGQWGWPQQPKGVVLRVLKKSAEPAISLLVWAGGAYALMRWWKQISHGNGIQRDGLH